MTALKTVYLAGPQVFLPDAVAVLEAKAALCSAFGFEAKLPGDNGPHAATPPDPATLSREIYQANVAMMTAADFGVFDLTPFRGVSADVGTAFELGLMTGMGKPVFAYTNVVTDYIDRISMKQKIGPAGPAAVWRDEQNWRIENFGNPDNLMLAEAVSANGAPMVRKAAPLPRLLHDLDGFKACLEQARDYFASKAT